jgi:drug/metabolite transporter (DMT)-like permease
MGVLAVALEGRRGMVLAPRPVAAMLYLAIPGSAVTFSLYYWLMAHMPATRLSLIAYTIPVVAVLVGVVFMHEPVTARMIAGGLLVVAGVAVAARPPGVRDAAARTPVEGPAA